MDILGVGGGELVAILVIALVVAGPTRMIRWAYLLGQFFAKLRVLWAQAAESLQKEFDAAGMDVKVPKDVPTRQTLRRDLTNMVNPLLREFREPLDEFTEEVRQTRAEVKNATTSLKSLNGSGSLSDPMGSRTPKPIAPALPAAVPSNLGTWGTTVTSPTPPAESPAIPSDLGTWGQALAASNPSEDSHPVTPTSTGEA